MNILKILQKCRLSSAIANQSTTRDISISASRSNIRWRLANGYPKFWSDRGTLTDAPDFSYADGRPTPYSSGQRARLLRQKEYTERIIYLLNGIKYVEQKKLDEMNRKKEEVESALNRKLKWKGVKETVSNEEQESNQRKLRWKRPKKETKND